MQWLELGKLILLKGAPLLAGVVAGAPTQALVMLITNAFEVSPINITAPDCDNQVSQLCEHIKNDPCAFDKLQKIQTDNAVNLIAGAAPALLSVMNKIV